MTALDLLGPFKVPWLTGERRVRVFVPRPLAPGVRLPVLYMFDGQNIFDVSCAINTAPPFENDIRSQHRGGANGVFGDGSVRFLGDRLDLKVLAAICTRNGGEPVTEF